MRKRSKKRIPQDEKPWARVIEGNQEILVLPARKTSRWVSGGRRDWNTRVLNTLNDSETSRLVRSSLKIQFKKFWYWKKINKDDRLNFAERCEKLNKYKILLHKQHIQKSRMSTISRYKNFCLFSGRGRTYNRTLCIARHHVRKLVNAGLLSGIIK